MRRLAWLVGPCWILQIACSGDTFTSLSLFEGGVEVDAGELDSPAEARPDVFEVDAGKDAPADTISDGSIDVLVDAGADTNACPYSGPSECSGAVDAYCTHYASCCSQFPGNGACSSWGASFALCKSHWTGNGFDCGSQKYSPNVCTQNTACKNEIVSCSCSTIFQSVNPASALFPNCPGFWSQF